MTSPSAELLDWESFAKRLLAAQHHGMHIEQESGHRWIYFELDADHFPLLLIDHPSIIAETKLAPKTQTFRILKEYGSFESALDRIDRMLLEVKLPSLIECFKDLNTYNDLHCVFGDGVPE